MICWQVFIRKNEQFLKWISNKFAQKVKIGPFLAVWQKHLFD
jgi:hypothetical protein